MNSRINLEQISTSVRGAITAPPRQRLVVSDLSSIESRLAGWLTGCTAINDIFQHGKDVYKDLATRLYDIPYQEVSKEQRTFAKPAALGAQYMLGGKGLTKYAEGYGVELTLQQAQQQIQVYRSSYPEIPACWHWLKDAIFTVLHGRVPRAYNYRVSIQRKKDFLTITLPSGRDLFYYKPEIIWGEAPWKDDNGEHPQIEKFSYMGKDAYSFQWRRITAHAGGIFENIIQAIARDILALWLTRVDAHGYNIVGHCHDEIICVEHEEGAEAALAGLNTLAAQPAPWAPDLLLDAAGYTSRRYRKD